MRGDLAGGQPFRLQRQHDLVDIGQPPLSREDDWSHQIYEDARARGQGKYRALRGLGSRWTRILWRCWTDHTHYDPAILHHTPEPTSI